MLKGQQGILHGRSAEVESRRRRGRGGGKAEEGKGRKGRERYGDYDGNDHECACVFTCAHGGRV